MRPPCEEVVRNYLPQLRARIVRNLIEEHGWTMAEAAKALEISSTASAKYKRIIESGTNLPVQILEGSAAKISEELSNGSATPESAITQICETCMRMRIEGPICRLHRSTVGGIENCKACLNVNTAIAGEAWEKLKVISELKKALLLLSTCREFEKLIPEVRTNIAMCTRNPKDESDVAAYPGRITTIKGRAASLSQPEFNASKHLSKILLQARKVNPRIRSVSCIKFNREVVQAMEKLKIKFTVVDREVYKDVETFIKETGMVGDAIVDPGGIGIEPVTYVFGEGAVDTVKKILNIANTIRKLSINRAPGKTGIAKAHHHANTHYRVEETLRQVIRSLATCCLY